MNSHGHAEEYLFKIHQDYNIYTTLMTHYISNQVDKLFLTPYFCLCMPKLVSVLLRFDLLYTDLACHYRGKEEPST